MNEFIRLATAIPLVWYKPNYQRIADASRVATLDRPTNTA